MFNKRRSKPREYLEVIVCLVMIGASAFPIIVPLFDTGRSVFFYPIEIIATVSLIVYAFGTRRHSIEGDNGSRSSKDIALLVALSAIALATVQSIFRGFDPRLWTYARVVIVTMAALAFLSLNAEGQASKAASIMTALTTINALQLYYFRLGAFRHSTILGNVAVYGCLVATVYPFLYSALISPSSLLVRIAAGFNVATSCFLLPYTGSRISLLVMVGVIVLTTVAINSHNLAPNRAVIVLIIIAFGVSYVYSFTLASTFDAKAFQRATLTEHLGESPNSGEGNGSRINMESESDRGSTANPDEEPPPLTVSTETTEASDRLRFAMWRKGMDLIREYPIVGSGLLTFPVQISGKLQEQSLHNAVLEVLVNYGLPIGLAYIYALYHLYRASLLKQSKARRRITLISLVAFFISSMFQPLMVNYIMIVFITLLLGLREDLAFPNKSGKIIWAQ